MPAMNFPSNPTNGQAYGQYVYDSTKGAWRVLADLIASAIPSPTAPTSPVSGDLWFNTNDGVLFMYFNDGNTSQWVEMKSNTASGSTVAARVDALEAKPNGLVQLIPTSISVGSGSASVGALGTITYSGVSSLNINGIFTSAYPNYRIVFQHLLASDTGLNLRLRAGGADNTSGVYNNHHIYWGPGGNGVNIISNHTVFGALFGHGRQRGAYELYAPQLATRTGVTFHGVAENGAGSTEQHTSSVLHKSDTQFDGVTIYPTSGSFTGTVQIYGYR